MPRDFLIKIKNTKVLRVIINFVVVVVVRRKKCQLFILMGFFFHFVLPIWPNIRFDRMNAK